MHERKNLSWCNSGVITDIQETTIPTSSSPCVPARIIETHPILIHSTLNESTLSTSHERLTNNVTCSVTNHYVPDFGPDDIDFMDEEDVENVDEIQR